MFATQYNDVVQNSLLKHIWEQDFTSAKLAIDVLYKQDPGHLSLVGAPLSSIEVTGPKRARVNKVQF
jgi:hypothetical protein